MFEQVKLQLLVLVIGQGNPSHVFGQLLLVPVGLLHLLHVAELVKVVEHVKLDPSPSVKR